MTRDFLCGQNEALVIRSVTSQIHLGRTTTNIQSKYSLQETAEQFKIPRGCTFAHTYAKTQQLSIKCKTPQRTYYQNLNTTRHLSIENTTRLIATIGKHGIDNALLIILIHLSHNEQGLSTNTAHCERNNLYDDFIFARISYKFHYNVINVELISRCI